MADRTCKNCKKIFKFPCMLEKHLRVTFHCMNKDKQTNNSNSNNNTLIINKESKKYKCVNCHHLFTIKDNYNKHVNICIMNKTTLKIVINTILDKLTKQKLEMALKMLNMLDE